MARRLGELLPSETVVFIESTDTDEAVKATHDPDAHVVLLENTRFLGGEETNKTSVIVPRPRATRLLYVNDAFGSRAPGPRVDRGRGAFSQAGGGGSPRYRRALCDFLGGALENAQRPFVAVLGGAKISGKIDVIEQLLPKVDRLIIGGAMACTFFRAMGVEAGKSLVEADPRGHGEGFDVAERRQAAAAQRRHGGSGDRLTE